MKRDDSLWKAILEDVFDDFLLFFFENADQIFDFDRPFEFLDKELERLFPTKQDEFSPKYVDKLVKVFTKTGDEKWILVHIEVQGNADKTFPQRMFQYYYRIFDKYQKPITAFAILTDNHKNFRPQEYQQEFLGTSLAYCFNTYKILEQDEFVLLESRNPFAMVVLTTLVALKKGKLSEQDLLNEKIALLRRLVSKGFSRQKIEALLGFLKLYVRFAKPENDVKFELAMQETLNKPKQTMGIVEFVLERERRIGEQRGVIKGEKRGEKRGIEKGIEKGFEKGIEVQKYSFVKTLLKETDFDDDKIALLAAVSNAFVQEVRNQINS